MRVLVSNFVLVPAFLLGACTTGGAPTAQAPPPPDAAPEALTMAYAPSAARWPRLVDEERGLVTQTSRVQVDCIDPGVVAILRSVEVRFAAKPVITSGYRSPADNRRAGGASKSFHTRCQAADIQVPGVARAQLAKFLRSIPGRGGVGTYCHTKSVHVDLGAKRDWNYRCHKRRR